MFELYLLPIIRKDGREANQITGLFAATAPRRCQRSRSKDRLFLWMTMVIGHSLITDDVMQKITRDAATLYYSTKGTVTTGLNAAANHINTALSVIGGGEPIGAKLNIAVLRGETLYMAHAGAVFTFLMRGNSVKAFFNPLSEKQLPGYVPAVRLQFFQTQVEMGDAFLFTPQPAQEWEREVLQFGDELSLPIVRRRLLDQTGGDFSAILMQLKPGKKGTFHRLRPSTPETQQSEMERAALQQTRKKPQPIKQPEEQTETSAVDIPSSTAVEPSPQIDEPTVIKAPQPQQTKQEKPRKQKPERAPLIERLPIPDFKKWGVGFAQFWIKLRQLDKQAQEPPIPEDTEDEADSQEMKPLKEEKPSALQQFKLPISNHLLLGIAVIVPLLVSVIAATVYSQRGVQQQYDTYFALAQQYTNEALSEQETIVRQAKLDQALEYLDQAEAFRKTTKSDALRTQINDVMEDTGEISRVEIFSALGQRLHKDINFTHLVTDADNNLFALDGDSGQVLYFDFTGSQYELDSSFQCSGSGLQKIVDIALLTPFNEMDASIVAIGETGNLLYCQPGKSPQAVNLQVPVFGWNAIVDMDVERDLLFVIDAGTRAVWSYYGPQQNFADADARLFFENDPPVNLAEVSGIDVFSDTMVFLSDDNQVTTCLVQSLDAEFRECLNLPPRDSNELQLQFINLDWIDFFPADFPPAFYLLDGTSETLYRFSHKMIINRAYRFLAIDGERLPDKPVTAFTITDNQLVILAYENEIYLGQLKVQ